MPVRPQGFSPSASCEERSDSVRYIFVTGGVVSSLGKGICLAALASLIEGHGYRVRMKKLDPYLNIDPGTMSPYQHGECFVTDDGAETDMDLGHYERFTGCTATRSDNITSGQVYQRVIDAERKGDFTGATVQVVPHVTNEIKRFIVAGANGDEAEGESGPDIVLCEIGGTVGDIEGLPFLEAVRQLRNELGAGRCLVLHCTLVPFIGAVGELKTKPTQHAVKELLGVGIQPDILLCRSERPLGDEERAKIALFSNMPPSHVVAAVDVDTVYAVPLAFHEYGLDRLVLDRFSLLARPDCVKKTLLHWTDFVQRVRIRSPVLRLALVGKYTRAPDSYKSLFEAITHSAAKVGVHTEVIPISSEGVELERLRSVHGVIVPGGFGVRGTEGMIEAVRFARKQEIPFLGICMGLQVAIIEFARSCADIADAGSSEFDQSLPNPVIGFLSQWSRVDAVSGQTEHCTRTTHDDRGGTMRLGGYQCRLMRGSRSYEAYGEELIIERHRHRYEVNPCYLDALAQHGMSFPGRSVGSSRDSDNNLVEIIELPDHPWFVAVQFHPELRSRPMSPHPLFVAFTRAMQQYAQKTESPLLQKVYAL